MPKSKRAQFERIFGMMAHTELATTDPAATQRFLEKIFGWKFDKVKTPTGDLRTYRTPGGSQGSVRPVQPREAPASINYILVKDLDATAEGIRKAGGEIVMPRVDVPGMGSFFWFKLPGGPILACWQDATERGGTTNG